MSSWLALISAVMKVIGIVFAVLLIPVLLFICVYMGTTAFYKARIHYLKNYLKGGTNHGQDEGSSQKKG
jgi:hypothetical protein